MQKCKCCLSARSQGADQKRQAFSKRKRGIVLKAYQLYKLCDAKVRLAYGGTYPSSIPEGTEPSMPLSKS